jgi:hypothetical protein
MDRRRFQPESLGHASKTARLDLTAERLAAVGPFLEGIYALIDGLDDVEVGETPPATAFDARWE